LSKDAERRARLEAAMGGGKATTRRAGPAPARPPAPPLRAAGASPALPHDLDPRPDGGRAARRTAAAEVAPQRRAGPLGFVADSRGLTAAGVALVCVAGCAIGAAWDLSRGTRILGTVTGVALIVAAVVAALTAHREDIGATVVAPPLAYAAVVLVAANITGQSGTGSYTHRVGAEVVVHVLTSAPGLLIAVGLTAVIALVRWLRARATANRRRAAARARAR
jgi:hypothetical protein